MPQVQSDTAMPRAAAGAPGPRAGTGRALSHPILNTVTEGLPGEKGRAGELATEKRGLRSEIQEL